VGQCEGYGLQPVHKIINIAGALALRDTVGEFLNDSPQVTANTVLREQAHEMY